ncbi:MAG: Csp1 family four helix bundle copper storage protein [Gammaproteobacteria bacterium]|jgi:Cys-rich four helix bundle protein (predicted Tat secretion target)
MEKYNSGMDNTGDMPRTLSRRDLLLGLGAAAVAAGAGPAVAAMPGHNHAEHAPRHAALLDDTNTCLDKGRRCIAHCLTSWREGDLELADCAAKVHEMEAVCQAFAYLLAANSTYDAQYAAVCEVVCRDCSEQCRKHKEHVECRECGEACDAVVEAIKKAFG